jgi:hypothetical protein
VISNTDKAHILVVKGFLAWSYGLPIQYLRRIQLLRTILLAKIAIFENLRFTMYVTFGDLLYLNED